MNTTRVKAERWALAILLAAQVHTVWSDQGHMAPAQSAPPTQAAPASQAASASQTSQASPAAPTSSGSPPVPTGPLPLTCEAPVTKDSGLALRIQLTADAFKKVVFDHPKPEGLPTGILGQSKICTCVDANGNLKSPVRLVRASGSPQLDAEATEIGKSISYPAGHPGCMHQTVNFTAP